MDRTIITTAEGFRSFDFISFEHDVLIGLTRLAADLLGSTSTFVSGFAATPDSPADLSINLATGSIYQLASADATADGAIPQDLTQILQQGLAAAQKVTLIAPTTSGQSQWNLIQVQFSQVDQVRANDPNGGNPPFYNSSNPNSPTYNSVNTERAGQAVVQVVTGAAAATGSEVPPSPTAGWVPLYLIDLSFGQTQITAPEILVAGPSVGTNVPSNYTQAPFITGLANIQNVLAAAGVATNGGSGQLLSALERLFAPVVGSVRSLIGSSAGGVKTASWTVKELVAKSALGGQPYLGTNLSLSFNGATTGAGGMDTGSTPTSADLSVYAIYNPTTKTWATLGCAGATSNGPVYSGANMPSGYTASALIWGGVTDSSGNLRQFNQVRDVVYLAGLNIATGLTASSATLQSVSNLIPSCAISALLTGDETTAGVSSLFLAPTSASAVGAAALWGSNSVNIGPFEVPLLTPQQVYYYVTSSGSWNLVASGYRLEI